MKTGRTRPAAPPRVQMAPYLRVGDDPNPDTVDFTQKSMDALDQMYLNDALGCCVIAMLAHQEGVLTANASGSPFLATDDQIVAAYSAIGGYVPGNPATDQGCDEQTAMAYAITNGVFGRPKGIGFAGVNAANIDECKRTIRMFEGLLVGMELPASWLANIPQTSGFTWDVAGPPVPANGHAVYLCGYTPAGPIVSTWGLLGTLTWGALGKYAVTPAGGELYTFLAPDLVARAQNASPGGVNWLPLLEALAAQGGVL